MNRSRTAIIVCLMGLALFLLAVIVVESHYHPHSPQEDIRSTCPICLISPTFVFALAAAGLFLGLFLLGILAHAPMDPRIRPPSLRRFACRSPPEID